MSGSRIPDETGSLNSEVRQIWDRNAAWWDEQVGPEGDVFHRTLIAPATERLLGLRPGELILDIACGNGLVARHLADLGARVVAFDFSEVFVERAKAQSAAYGDRIEYRVLDAADTGALRGLGEGRFDAAVCTMALMDMATIEPLGAALARLLKPRGRFVFSVTHPCFNQTGATLMAEEVYRDGELVTVFSVKVTEYIRPVVRKGIGIRGQPEAQYFFERPLVALFGPFFAAGLVLDALEEPVFGPGTDRAGGFSWRNYADIPPALVARLRRPSGRRVILFVENPETMR